MTVRTEPRCFDVTGNVVTAGCDGDAVGAVVVEVGVVVVTTGRHHGRLRVLPTRVALRHRLRGLRDGVLRLQRLDDARGVSTLGRVVAGPDDGRVRLLDRRLRGGLR